MNKVGYTLIKLMLMVILSKLASEHLRVFRVNHQLPSSTETLCDCSEIDAELDELMREIEVVTELFKKAIYENARVAVSQDEWSERNNSYLERHRKATDRVAELEKLKCERKNKYLMLETFIRGIESRPLVLEELDNKLWGVAVEKVKVMPDGRLVFSFKDGTEIIKNGKMYLKNQKTIRRKNKEYYRIINQIKQKAGLFRCSIVF